jgi:hypothetical protein
MRAEPQLTIPRVAFSVTSGIASIIHELFYRTGSARFADRGVARGFLSQLLSTPISNVRFHPKRT